MNKILYHTIPRNFGVPPGRGRLVSAHSSPPWTKRLGLILMCNAKAIMAGDPEMPRPLLLRGHGADPDR